MANGMIPLLQHSLLRSRLTLSATERVTKKSSNALPKRLRISSCQPSHIMARKAGKWRAAHGWWNGNLKKKTY